MDQTLLNPHTIDVKLSALSIEGSGDAPITQQQPFYRSPGYSTPNLELMQLLTKPFYLPIITVDSSFTSWNFLVTSFQPFLHQWVPKFVENFVSPLFNINLTFMIPGHQFAVVKLGFTYVPNLVANDKIFVADAGGNDINVYSTSIMQKYNVVASLRGTFVDISPNSNTVTVKSSIPSPYPMNPADKSNSDPNGFNVYFGGFRIDSIVPPRFGMDITKIELQPMVNLTDVALMPWR